MRIMIDTNILISAFLFRNKNMDNLLRKISEEHKLILSSFILNELLEVVKRKFPNQKKALDNFLTAIPFELVYTPRNMKEDLFFIRDKKDYPVLYSAIIEDIDVFITGDKDFTELEIEKPQIMTPSDFLRLY